MTILALVLRVLLIGVFLWAAWAKAAGFRDFSSYLSVPFGRYGRYVAWTTIGTEALIALTGIVPAFLDWWPYLTAAVLIAFTGFYAIRLNLSDETSCACWGSGAAKRGLSEQSRILAPAWVGIRNLTLALAALLSARPVAGANQQAIWSQDLAIAASTVVVLAIGLATSVIRVRNSVGRDWADLYAPRWSYLSKGTCRVTGAAHDHGPGEFAGASQSEA